MYQAVHESRLSTSQLWQHRIHVARLHLVRQRVSGCGIRIYNMWLNFALPSTVLAATVFRAASPISSAMPHRRATQGLQSTHQGLFLYQWIYLLNFYNNKSFLSMNFEFDPLGLPCVLHGPHGSRVTQNGHFSLSKHTKHLLLVTFCDRTAKIGVNRQSLDGKRTAKSESQTDVEVSIVVQITFFKNSKHFFRRKERYYELSV